MVAYEVFVAAHSCTQHHRQVVAPCPSFCSPLGTTHTPQYMQAVRTRTGNLKLTSPSAVLTLLGAVRQSSDLHLLAPCSSNNMYTAATLLQHTVQSTVQSPIQSWLSFCCVFEQTKSNGNCLVDKRRDREDRRFQLRCCDTTYSLSFTKHCTHPAPAHTIYAAWS